MKTEHLLLLLLVAGAAVGGFLWWRKSNTKEPQAAPYPQQQPPPVAIETTPTVPAKKFSAKDAVALGATVGCTAYTGGAGAPVCALAAPLVTDLAWKGGKKAYKAITGLF